MKELVLIGRCGGFLAFHSPRTFFEACHNDSLLRSLPARGSHGTAQPLDLNLS